KQKEALKQAEINFVNAERHYEAEKQQEETRDNLKIDLQKHMDLLPAVKDSLQVKAQIAEMKQRLQEETRQLSKGQEKKEKQQEAIINLKNIIKKQDAHATQVYELNFKL